MSTKNKHNALTTSNTFQQKVVNDPVKSTVEVETTKPVSLLPASSKNIRFEYKVVVIRNNQDMFQTTVTEHLNDGWELSGGVSCTMYADSYSASTIWTQAVYKKVSN